MDSAVITRPPGLLISAGQYLALSQPGDFLPRSVFPTHWEGEHIELAGPLPSGWQAGNTLRLRGPLGKGFILPPTVRRVAAGGLDSSPSRLLPLIWQALEQGAEVCLYTATLPAGLPEVVEVLPPNLLPDAWEWADYLALDCAIGQCEQLRAILPSSITYHLPCPAQVLVYAQMPCGACADCGICAVKTNHGWLQACKDGPVFDLAELLL